MTKYPSEDAMTYPYPENPGATHFEGCWKTAGHMNCTVAKVYELERELAEVRGELDRITRDRDAKTKRMWELGHECDQLQRDLEAARRERDTAYERVKSLETAQEIRAKALREALGELTNIANAKPDGWDDPSDFRAWAQNRAQHTLSKIAQPTPQAGEE